MLLGAAAFAAGGALATHLVSLAGVVGILGGALVLLAVGAQGGISIRDWDAHPDLVMRVDRVGTCLAVAGGRDIVLVKERSALLGTNLRDVLPPEAVEPGARCLESAFATGEPQSHEFGMEAGRDLRTYEMRMSADSQDYVLVIVRETTARKNSQEEALRRANEALEAIIDNSPLAIYAVDLAGRVKSWNRAAERMFGWTEAEALEQELPCVAVMEDAAASGALSGLEGRSVRKDGSAVELSVWRSPLRDAAGTVNGFITVAADVTEHKSLELQLQQSQRLEAVGRLAGGVAHDFNNLLTVITGYGYMLLGDLAAEAAPRANVEEILKAVDRASALTVQLLAFSRRQIAQPKTIDVNDLVLNMDKMLRRVIGEDIELVTALSPDAGKVHADSGQLEQVIVNLVVNSRDALPEGGRITIETANATLDEAYARTHLKAKAGEYVMLSVMDTGHGMDEETKAHIFEPFFTTKELGKGTGLGLAQVYGIVKQSGGEIAVTSDLGAGTRIRIYLPRIFGKASADAPRETDTDLQAGTETVLLVEDEDDVRRLVYEVLEQHGYTVLPAAQPQEAIDICRSYRGRIDLLLTDVVMPRMGGRDLAEKAAEIRPDMKVLYMSGYTEDAMLGASFGEAGVAFLRKPFTPVVLTRKIRDVLEERSRGLGAAVE
jgi:two-component system, cell cycle sensor histidine kinase and response regulator CckA